MSTPRLRFASLIDAYLAVSSVVLILFASLLMVMALVSDRYGLAAFNILLILLNSTVLGSVVARMERRAP